MEVPAVPAVRFDRFYRYDELSSILHAWAEEQPALFALSSIGQSHEGREIWLATVTNTATGPHHEKPAFWLDANIHAIEVTGCTAALHLLHRLLSGHGSDERVTRALDTRTFYVVPRLGPDGAELALATPPQYVRSGVRAYPRPDALDGLHEGDVDSDGRILSMRLRDPNGAWKPCTAEPRLLVPREPDETGGDYYRLLPEGTLHNYDGITIKTPPPLEGLDFNRNFPSEWTTESEQQGAGPFPASEPEVLAAVRAIVERPNITGGITYHTFSGVHLRPYSAHDDEHFPTADLRVFKRLGKEATRLTGYPAVSVFHDFRYEPKEFIKGGWDDWMYDHLGTYAWTTEFWSPQREAGITDYHFIDWFSDHPLDDDLALLRWSDNVLGGRGFIDWYAFDHPQLGPVELGGWDWMGSLGNVPLDLLEREIAPHSELALFSALVSPLLAVRSLESETVAPGVHRVRLVLENTGWLPTNVSQKALDRKIVRPLEVHLTLPADARLLSGEQRTEAGQLSGRETKLNMLAWDAGDATSDRVKLEWVIDTPTGGTLGIEARHQRAGVVRREVALG
jgi:murein tripeptide amidase MpaA